MQYKMKRNEKKTMFLRFDEFDTKDLLFHARKNIPLKNPFTS